MAEPRIAIVGAGIGGLTAAALLGPHAEVTVYERSEKAGGKIRQVVFGNRGIDCGPTVFTMKPLFERIFSLCGERIDDHLRLTPLSVLARHHWQDGSSLDLYADKERSAEAIAAFAGQKEADAYLGFIRMAGRTWKTLYSPLIEQEEANFGRLLSRTPPQRLIQLNPYISLWRELSGRFRDERLRQLFGRYATYCGSSPFKAPGVLAMIAHIEQEGVWAIDGGITALADALMNIARKRGARFSFGASIEGIERDGNTATGVLNGAFSPAEGIIFNGDVAALSAGNLAGAHEPARAPERSLSAITMCTEGSAKGTPLALHNVFFSSDYRGEFDTLARQQGLPEDPTVYLYAPDFDQSPEENNRFMALINAPPDGDRKAYTEGEVSACRNRILTQLKRCGLKLQPDPASTVMTTPADFARRFPATGGALYGRPVHGWRASFQRPGIRTRTRGLYCAGGSVHPGSGVPMAALSGLMAARAVMQDYALT
jgi:1-hydroxycarotenoid 3,4-desaturase